MFEIHNLLFRYNRRSPEVLRGIHLELQPGEIGILLGRNGAGKSTLFQNIIGIEKPLSGDILLNGKSILGMRIPQRAKQIAYVPQTVNFGDLTVFDTVLTGRLAHFGLHAGQEDIRATEQVLDEMGLTDFAHRSADRLSGGEKQKVAIARAIVGEPELIVFDEPTGNLDLANERLLMEESRRLAKERGIAILCSLHGLNEALELGDRFYFMKDGIIRYNGGKDIFTEDVIADVFGVQVKIVSLETDQGTQNIITGGTIV